MNVLLANFSLEPLTAILLIPIGAVLVLALLPGYWLAARFNVLATLSTLVAALFLLFERPGAGSYLFVDDLNDLDRLVPFLEAAMALPRGLRIEIGVLESAPWDVIKAPTRFQLPTET